MFGDGLPGRNKRRFIGKGLVGYARHMKFKHDLNITQTNDIVQKRLEVVQFFDKHGLTPTVDAFKVSKSTVYAWRSTLKENKYQTMCLIPKSTKPKHLRKSQADPLILKFIKDIRESTFRMGKVKIKPLLDAYCEERHLPIMSESWIGKQIKNNNWYFEPVGRTYHDPSAHHPKRGRKKDRALKGERVINPGQQLQIDSITRFDLNTKRYIITAVDLYSRFSFAYTYKSLSSKIALDFYQKLETVAPFKIQTVKTDNGLEFEGYFDSYLKDRGITHYF